MITATIQTPSNVGAALPGLPETGMAGLPAQAQMAAVLAGARARGVADTLDMLGLAAILIGADGVALHVNTQAAACMGQQLGICSRQLVAATYAVNAQVQLALDNVLAGSGPQSVHIGSDSASPPVTLHFLALPGASGDSCQMLKAVIILEQGGASCGEMALAARIISGGPRLN